MNRISDPIDKLDNADEEVSKLARSYYHALGSQAIPSLKTALFHHNEGIAEEAARVLGMLEKDAIDAIPELIKATKDDRINLRAYAVGALGRIRQRPDLTLAPLVYALSDSQAIVRQHAVAALSMFGMEAVEVVPELVVALSDTDATVREFSSSTLRDIKEIPTPVLSRLRERFENSEGITRRHIKRWISASSQQKAIPDI